MLKKFAALFVIAVAFLMAGCNTVRGVGQDVQKAGSVIEDATKKK